MTVCLGKPLSEFTEKSFQSLGERSHYLEWQAMRGEADRCRWGNFRKSHQAPCRSSSDEDRSTIPRIGLPVCQSSLFQCIDQTSCSGARNAQECGQFAGAERPEHDQEVQRGDRPFE